MRDSEGCEIKGQSIKELRVATSPAEAVAMLRSGPGRGCYVAGGTDLIPSREGYDFLVDINQVGLTGLDRTAQGDVIIGATTPLSLIRHHDVIRGFAGGELARLAGQWGQGPERSAATIGGHLCRALPPADLAPVLLTLDALCFIVDEESQESLLLADFFPAPERTILGDRLLAGVVLPGEAASRRCHALEAKGEDAALVQVAVGLDVSEGVITTARIALGALAPVPLRCLLAEDQLAGQKVVDITRDVIEDVAVIAAGESDPVDDHRASAGYRQDQARELTRRLLCRALGESGGPDCGDDGDEGEVA